MAVVLSFFLIVWACLRDYVCQLLRVHRCADGGGCYFAVCSDKVFLFFAVNRWQDFATVCTGVSVFALFFATVAMVVVDFCVHYDTSWL